MAKVAVTSQSGEHLNGLGKMMLQYLEQNLEDFPSKAKQALGIRGRLVVKVEQEIAITLSFEGEKIQVDNGVSNRADFYLAGPFLLLVNVLSGRSNPFLEVVKGHIRVKPFFKRPIQALKILRFLKIPSGFMISTNQEKDHEQR
jgi:hypothetical protein